jgi:outer membrane protein OmpA-like peptidoglycan-associated protein/flagellar hook assembly protein FlgD
MPKAIYFQFIDKLGPSIHQEEIMSSIRRAIIPIAICLAIGTVSAFADTPASGSLFPILGSAQALGYGPSVTALDSPWADRENPAASADQQRTVLDAGYTALTDFGAGQGFGGAGALGLSLPTPYAVWSASAELVSTPSSMTDLPWGTVGGFRGGIAKDLYPNFFVGSALDLNLGDKGWGAGLNLGFMSLLGDHGLFKDMRWGTVLSGIGKTYSNEMDPLTLSSGVRAYIVRTDDWKIGLGVDLSFPQFQDLEFDLATGISYRGIVTFRMNWDQYLRELMNGSNNKSLVPSFGLVADIPLKSAASDNSYLSKQGWNQAELQPAIVAAPLYGNIWALGASATVPLGVINKTPPKIVASFPASKWGPAYISPNNYGIHGNLEIPVKITDARYVVGWTFSISDAKGEVVRKIFNRETIPETEGVKGILDRLTYVKKGVLIPDKLVWNGVADSGKVVPDGAYTATIEAVDDNGNRSSVGPFPIVVKDTAPTITLSVPEDPPIFSPDGNSSKTTLLIKLSGSVEDLWSAEVTDVAGKTVKTLKFENSAPSDWTWDGLGDDGKVVPDGVYFFSISATDRAGNSVSKRFDNIIVNTQQPPVGLIIDLAAFSPNTQSLKGVVTLFPSVPVKTGIVGWRLSVLDKGKREVWFQEGKDSSSLKDRVPFDGRDPVSQKTLPEGQYQALLSVVYLNGYNAKANSPSFVLDVTPPSGIVSSDRPAFNPAGNQGQNSVHFLQKGVKDARWVGEVSGPDGKVVRTFSFSPLPDADVEWDGTDNAGKPVTDGVYSYRLKAEDAAGNPFASDPVTVTVDTAKKAVRLLADYKAFSPLPGSSKDRLTLTAQVQSNDRVRSYELSIISLDASGAEGAAVRTWKDRRGVPETFIWDGTTDAKTKAPDGRYAARLAVSYLNGDSADSTVPSIMVRTVAPSIQVSASPLLFSPTEGSRLRVVRFTQTSVPGDDWMGVISGPDGKPIRAWSWKGQASDFVWDGTDEAGNTVPDGRYRYDVASIDIAGNKGSGAVPSIVVDQRQVQVFVTASDPGISPNGSGFKDKETFNLIVKLREGIDSWHFAVVDKDGVERSVFGGKGDDVPNKIVWDGHNSSGAVVDGYYTGFFSVDYLKGDHAEARTGKILVDTQPPKAQVSLTPDLFSPDSSGNGNELSIGLDVSSPADIATWSFEVREQAVVEGATPGSKPAERLFKSWNGTGIPPKTLLWDGRSDEGELVESATDYPFVFTVTDVLGNSAQVEGAISIDVLVERDGDRLKIKVPSIVFRANGTDFNGLDAATVDNNMKVIKRIAQILNKFKDYSILIEGHANSEGKIGGYSAAAIAKEETGELIPLSSGRAELVKKLLTDNGVDANRLSTKGMGSSEPVVDFADAQNRWKNRRVEFILIKNQTNQTTGSVQ